MDSHNELSGTVQGNNLQARTVNGDVHFHASGDASRLVGLYEELADARRRLVESMQAERDLTQVVWMLQALVLRLQDTTMRLGRDRQAEIEATAAAQDRAERQLGLAETERATAVRLLRVARERLTVLQAAVAGPMDLPRAELSTIDLGLDEIDSFLVSQGARLSQISEELGVHDEPLDAVEVAALSERLLEALLLNSPDVAEALIHRMLGPLLKVPLGERRLLLDTLNAWLSTGGSINQTSKTVQCHRNTVINRLRRIESISELDLTDTATHVRLALALRACQLLPHSPFA